MKLIRITTVPISLKYLLKGQPRYMMENGFEVVGISSAGQELIDVQNSDGIRVLELEMTRTISPFRDFKSLWNFYKICKTEKPVLVHSHTPKAGIIGMLGSKLAGVPIRLHTVAGMPLMEARGMKRAVLDFVEKLTYASATRVYPNSNRLYEFIVEKGFASLEKIKVIANGSSNGIDTNFFSQDQISDEVKNLIRKKTNIFPSDFVFIFVGRLVGDKGINELIKAFQMLEDKEAKLVLVGSLEPKLDPLHHDTLLEIENNPNIISVGFQNDVRPYFAISNALVFPSYREGFPNVVMQAGAMELPAIVSNINGCNEIIIDGENGKIIPVKNIEAIRDAMLMMIKNKDRYLEMKENSRRMITERYEQQVVWDALLNEYRSLLKDKGLDNV